MRGFSLIEALVYIALLSFLLVSLYVGLIGLTEAARKDSARALVEYEGGRIESLFAYELDHAREIDVVGNQLTLETDAGTRSISLEAGTLMLGRTPTTMLPFSSERVLVTELSMTQRGTQRGDERIELSFTLSTYGANGKQITSSFELTRFLAAYPP